MIRSTSSTLRTLIRTAALATSLAALPTPPPAAAQTTDPRIEVWLHASVVGVQTASTGRPTVRLLDAAGNQRAEVIATGQPAGGRWQIALTPAGADLTQQVLIHPGDRIEVILDGRTTRVTAPEMTVRPDAAADLVTGTAPPGTLALYAQLHRDESWYDPPHNPAAVGPVLPRTDGGFEIPLAGKFDLAPGTWGELIAIGADGHFTVFQFAPPAVTIHTTQPYAILRATPPERPVLSMQSEIGTELFRSAPAYALGGSVFAVPMVQDGIIENGIYSPGPNETVVLQDAGGSPGTGRTLLEAPLPRVLTTIDDAGRRVHGYAPAGARTVVTLSATGAGDAAATQVVAAGTDGRFSAAFPGQAVDLDAAATVLAYPGHGVARITEGTVPSQNVVLYGHVVDGTIPGWDEVQIEQRAPDGSLRARASARADAGGAFAAELITPAGRRSILAPGDRLVFTPQIGTTVNLVIPLLSATVDAGKRVLSGQAPPGTMVIALVHSGDPDYFGFTSFDQGGQFIEGHSDGDGNFSLPCALPAPDCVMRYGLVGARAGSISVILQWLDTPFVGVGVTVANAIGRATAGLPIRVQPRRAGGELGAPITDVVRPGLNGSLPGLEIPLEDSFPEGLRVGDGAAIGIGGNSYDVVVPALDWQARPARDTVSGTGPAARLLILIAFARGDAATRPAAGTASTVIGLDRRWQARFDAFDLRNGDDLELYLLADNHFLWWTESAVWSDEPEPTPTAGATPTAALTATPPAIPTATRSPAGRRWSIYLPIAACWR